MKNAQDSHYTHRAAGSAGCPAFGLPFGACNGPGLLRSLLYQRSCRCTLARRRGASASVSGNTNSSDSHTFRLKVAALSLPRMVSGHVHPHFDDELGSASALTEMVCGNPGNADPASFWHGTAFPFGGPAASRRSVAVAIASRSRQGCPLTQGQRVFTPVAGARRSTSF